jgi:glycosyltransferase involved in cell wall biosynthesis
VRVLIVHFRSAPARDKGGQMGAEVEALDSAGTDGVSLEIAKRRGILESMGHHVAVCSAYGWADFPVPALEFDREDVAKLVRNLFGTGIEDFSGEAELRAAFDLSRAQLKQHLKGVVDDFRPDLIFVHNVLSLPVHPAATVALAEVLRETGLPCAAIHHDVHSEGAYEFTATGGFASELLEGYFPPRMPNLSHWTINTRNQGYLREKGFDAGVIHDTMDFDHRLESGERVRIRAHLRAKYGIGDSDIVLLAAARIVPNKQTELAGRLTSVMQHLRGEMVGKKLYSGETFMESSRIVLVVAGRPERGFTDYKEKVFESLDLLRVPWVYAGDSVRPHRVEREDLYALYPDFYTLADFVLYPTRWEGFGNQLLEAFAAGLPVAVFEYPVFKEDIAPKGVAVVSLGDTLLPQGSHRALVDIPIEILAQAASEISTILTSPAKYRDIVDNNLLVGRRYFGFDVLRSHLRDALRWAGTLSS